MKKLTKEELEGLPLLKKGRTSRINMNLAQLLPGEGLQIEKQKDWVGKRPPYQMITRFAKKHGWKLEAGRMPDNNGWIVRRVS